MAQEPEDLERQEPVAHVRVVYLGPVAPHWDVQEVFGDRGFLSDFRQRVEARLQMLPPYDPQFRRNRERVNRDAQRERITCDWDLGYEEDDDSSSSAASDA